MRILVCGGAGFIGSCFIKHMLECYPNYKIINLDALTYAGNLDNLKDIQNNKNYDFFWGNICDRDTVDRLMSKVNAVVNFAAESHVDRSIVNPNVFIETNIKGTLTLLDSARQHGIRRFIQISTDEVYGSLNKDDYFYETTPLAPNSPYAASKASADMLVRSFYKTYNFPGIITRSSNNYGPFQYPEKLIPYFITQLLKGEKVPVYGDGSNIRDWLFVYDHCRAIDIVLHKGKPGEVYNIGGHNEKTNLEMTKIILDSLGKDESCIEYVEDRPGHDKRYAICSDKIQKELGWKPEISFETGIALTIDWYLNNREWIDNIQMRKAGFSL